MNSDVGGGDLIWMESDVTADWPISTVDIWHDRALFHFLTDPGALAKYVERLRRGLRAGGTLIMVTFAPDGPERCSGLPVMRYSPERLASELGLGFHLQESVSERHETPSGTVQPFYFCRFRFD